MTMDVLRVTVTGPVTSFRYPHFLHGVQPTYEMPPPATLYGHVCSALGEPVDPASFHVGLHFTHQGRWYDYEHTHLFGRDPKLSPFERQLLFQPHLVLYIDRPDWIDAFRSPRYVVTLGRSQDLMVYSEVRRVSLQVAQAAYVEQALLPLDQAAGLRQHVALTMPRYLTPDRQVTWGRYAMTGAPQPWDGSDWIDPEAPFWRGRARAVTWLSFI